MHVRPVSIEEGSVVYGLGESTRDSLSVPVNSTTTLWNRDQASADFYTNLYGSHPFYIQVNGGGEEASGMTASGVFLRNSNGMDITYDGKGVIYKVRRHKCLLRLSLDYHDSYASERRIREELAIEEILIMLISRTYCEHAFL